MVENEIFSAETGNSNVFHGFKAIICPRLGRVGASCSVCSKTYQLICCRTEDVQGGQARRALSAAQAGSIGDFCSQPRVFHLVVQEPLKGATQVSAQPARAECLLCLI